MTELSAQLQEALNITALFGPTASAKTQIAVLAAQASQAVIINADAMQIYRPLATLTARPTAQEMQAAPHKLYGILEAEAICNAAKWSALAMQEIRTATAQNKPILIVGGTGFYIRSLQEGLAQIPQIEPAIQQAVRALPLCELWPLVHDCDPVIAQKLAPNDGQRLRRALEVFRQTQRPLSDWQAQAEYSPKIPMKVVKLLPEREALYQRCNLRLELMWRQAVEEVALYNASNPSPAWPLSKAIGVPEIQAYLSGNCSESLALEKSQQHTRNYAKRQLTWLRNQHNEAIILPISTFFDNEITDLAENLTHIITKKDKK